MSDLLTALYQKSPAFLQNIGVSLYGLKIYRREYGRKLNQLLEEFEQHAAYSPTEMQSYQDERLTVLIKHCFENVPYYRRTMKERNLTPLDIRRVADLPKLPLLTKEDVREQRDELLATNLRRSSIVYGHTSGTTGSPLQLYWDKHLCLIKNVMDWRMKGWAGIKTGEKIALFLGRIVVPVTQKHAPFWRYNWTLNHLYFSSFHMSSANLDSYVTALESYKPSAIEGYPSTLYIMARHLQLRGKTIPMRAAFTSSETLFPRQREAIESAFMCPVFDFYSMAERVVFANECEAHNGTHLSMDYGITEILAGAATVATSGNVGRVIGTSLHNFGMPLLRYRTSDVTSISDRPCSCGRKFPLLEGVMSKADDIVTTPDGRYISPVVFEHPFKPLRFIAESQLVQEDIQNLVVRIVKLPGYTEKDTEHLQREIRNRIGEGIEIRFEFVDQIERTAAGKFRRVVSKVPLRF